MGMYTAIVHPDDGRELQIKCGNDECRTYKVGDSVGAHPITTWAGEGYLLDDVYSSYSNRGPDDWVVIQGGVVVALEPKEKEYGELYAQYNIQPPPREWWPEEAWAKKEALEAKWAEENAQFKASIAHLPPEQQAMLYFMRPLGRQLNYAGLARSIFQVEPLPEGASVAYDRDVDVTAAVLKQEGEDER